MTLLAACVSQHDMFRAPITRIDAAHRLIVINGRTVYVPPMFFFNSLRLNEPYTMLVKREPDGRLVATQIMSSPANKN